MYGYENNKKEHKVTIVIGVVLIVLLAIFVVKKRFHSGFDDVRPVVGNEDSAIADILADTSFPEEADSAGIAADEIRVSVGGINHVVEPVVPVTPDDEIIEPVSREQKEKEYTTYVVKKGDTLSGIAQRFYGDSSRWQLIAKANDLANPNMMRVGMELMIPQKKKEGSVRQPRLEASARIEVASAPEVGTKGGRDYTVKKNDSLWKIAKAEYGDGNRWLMVFDANKNSLRDKDLLKAGQIIKLPER